MNFSISGLPQTLTLKFLSCSVKNITFVKTPQKSNSPPAKGLQKLKKKLQQGAPVSVLLLGDSITALAKNRSHSYFAFEQLRQHFKSEIKIVNCAISGHSARSGRIVLPRSLAALPQPDLVCLLYGANDCKAIETAADYNSKVFESHLQALIQSVSNNTANNPEFLLINGVPRVDQKTMLSKGLVEPLLPAYDRISDELGLIKCDTMSAFLELPVQAKRSYYKDTIHQQEAGQKFMGSVIATKLLKHLKP